MARTSSVGIGLRSVLAGLSLLALAAPAAAQPDAVQRARLREDNAREAWQRVPEILVALNLVPGARVADVGAGDGFFTLRLARAVGPTGRVIAEDIDPNALARLRSRAAEELLQNVEVVRGEVGDPHLPVGSLDAVLLVDAYHELEQLTSMLEHIRQALKPGGRLVLVDPIDPRLRGTPRVEQVRVHSLESGFAALELRAARFDLVGIQDPFTRRGTGTEQWMIVAERGPDAAWPAPAAPSAVARPSDGPGGVGTPTNPSSPDLRTTVAHLEALVKTDGALVLDVRDAESYVEGHIPGAILVPLDDLASRLPELQRERRPIVAYCT